MKECIDNYATNSGNSEIYKFDWKLIKEDKKTLVNLLEKLKKHKCISDEQISEVNKLLSEIKITSVPTYYYYCPDIPFMVTSSNSNDIVSSVNNFVGKFVKTAKLYMHLNYCKRFREILIDMSKKYKNSEETNELDTMFDNVDFNFDSSDKKRR